MRPHTNTVALSTETASSRIDGRNDASFLSEPPFEAHSRAYKYNTSGAGFSDWPEHNHTKRNPDNEDQLLLHFTQRQAMPLSTSDDSYWLSEYQCFIRAQCLEVFEAAEDDITSRKKVKKIREGQVGIRCRFCAHQPKRRRVGRSSSFPSSKSRIYQSVTMMLRDHFVYCKAMPLEIREHYLSLKENKIQGAKYSKEHWANSAGRLGLADTADGLRFL